MAVGAPANHFVVYAPPGSTEVVYSTSRRKQLLRYVAGASALLLVAVLLLSGQASRSTATLMDDGVSDPQSSLFGVQSKLSRLATDFTDRDVLKQALMSPSQISKAILKEESKKKKVAPKPAAKPKVDIKLEREMQRVKSETRAEHKREMSASIMVPWVHWPGHGNTGGGDRF